MSAPKWRLVMEGGDENKKCIAGVLVLLALVALVVGGAFLLGKRGGRLDAMRADAAVWYLSVNLRSSSGRQHGSLQPVQGGGVTQAGLLRLP